MHIRDDRKLQTKSLKNRKNKILSSYNYTWETFLVSEYNEQSKHFGNFQGIVCFSALERFWQQDTLEAADSLASALTTAHSKSKQIIHHLFFAAFIMTVNINISEEAANQNHLFFIICSYA